MYSKGATDNINCVVVVRRSRRIGSLPPVKIKLIAAWIEIHRDELIADWSLAARKEPLFKIEPLR